MALMYLSPLSGFQTATLPHELLSSYDPAPPKPILESHRSQKFKYSLETIPILVLVTTPSQLKPSMLQCSCKEACEPISVFHVSRPNEVLRYFPSASIEYKDPASLLMTIKFSWWSTFIPRQILEKGVFQYVGNLVSCESNPVFPPGKLKEFLSLQYLES